MEEENRGKAILKDTPKKGYPKRGDSTRIIIRPWMGYEIQTIVHSQFGGCPVKVFAIIVNQSVTSLSTPAQVAII